MQGRILDHGQATPQRPLNPSQLHGRQARQRSLAQAIAVDGTQMLGADIGGFQKTVSWCHFNSEQAGVLMALSGERRHQYRGQPGLRQLVSLQHDNGPNLADLASLIRVETGYPDLSQTRTYRHHGSPASYSPGGSETSFSRSRNASAISRDSRAEDASSPTALAARPMASMKRWRSRSARYAPMASRTSAERDRWLRRASASSRASRSCGRRTFSILSTPITHLVTLIVLHTVHAVIPPANEQPTLPPPTTLKGKECRPGRLPCF